MTEQTWEFCELRLYNLTKTKITKGPLKGQIGTYYDCIINYYSPSGDVIHEQLPEASPQRELQPTTFNPYSKAMGLLGAAGWELVSVQYGIIIRGAAYGSGGGGDIRWDNCYAYFKRPIVAGRAINKPKLNL